MGNFELWVIAFALFEAPFDSTQPAGLFYNGPEVLHSYLFRVEKLSVICHPFLHKIKRNYVISKLPSEHHR